MAGGVRADAPLKPARSPTLMDKMTEAAGGPLTFGDIKRADQAANQADETSDRAGASTWASAAYETRAARLKDIGIESGEQFDAIVDSAWNQIPAGTRARLSAAMRDEEMRRYGGGSRKTAPNAAAPVSTQAPAQAGATVAAAPAPPQDMTAKRRAVLQALRDCIAG